MADWELGRVVVDVGIAALSGFGSAVVTAWKWGRGGAKAEQAVKDDYNAKIASVREEARTTMASHAKHVDEGNDRLIAQFKESFEGIRRQFDEHKFYTEKDFVKKDDFSKFREEHREDLRDIKKAIDGVQRLLSRQ